MMKWWSNGGKRETLIGFLSVTVTSIFFLGCLWTRFIGAECRIEKAESKQEALEEKVEVIRADVAEIKGMVRTLVRSRGVER